MLAVSCLVGSRVQVYAVDSGRKLREFDGMKEPIHAAIFSPDGKMIVAGGRDGEVVCWNVATGAKVRTLATEGGSVFPLAFSLDGKRLAAADKGVVWVWNWPEAKLLHRLRCANAIIRDIAFSPDGKTLATSGDKGYGLRLWDVASGKEQHHLPAHEDQINAVAFSPDGSLLASAGDNRCVSLWDMRPPKGPRLLTKGNRRFTAVAQTPDGKSLVTSERDGSLVLWDAHDGYEVRRLQSWACSAARLTISPDGKWLAACAASGALGLWELPTGRRRPTPRRVPAAIGCAAFSPDSDAVALGDERGVVHVCATATGARIRTIPPEPPEEPVLPGKLSGVRAMAWSADGRTLAISYWDGRFTLHDVLLGRKPIKWRGPTHGGNAFAFSADGRLLAVADGHSIIRVYEMASGQEIQRTPATRLRMLSVAFAPDGRTLAFGGGTTLELHYYNHFLGLGLRSPGEVDFSIRLWDFIEGKELRCLAGHTLQVESLAFSPDGASLVSQGADATMLSWDVAALACHPARRGAALSASRLSELWTDLASRDAVRGQKAVGQLIRSPDAALPLLAGKLTPAPTLQRERIPTLLADLDSDEFARREKATRELQHLGEIAALSLRKALKEKPSLEARKRIESILEALDGQTMTPEQMRAVRALQALESIGTPKACRVLEGLAGGAPEAGLTQEAKASLQRLARRPTKP